MPLHLDVFHALWESYHGAGDRPRQPGVSTKGQTETAARQEALKTNPIGNKVRKEFADFLVRRKTFIGAMYGFSDPYWRVRYLDGD